MGLDFGIYYKKKTEEMPKESDWSEWMDNHELCYGRKSFELVHYLNLPSNGDDPVVNKKDWDRLITALNKLLKGKSIDYFDTLREEYRLIDKYEQYDKDIPPHILEDVLTFESWYDTIFDETPTLGYEFALGYIKEFYEANNEIQKYFNNDEYEVKAYISY